MLALAVASTGCGLLGGSQDAATSTTAADATAGTASSTTVAGANSTAPDNSGSALVTTPADTTPTTAPTVTSTPQDTTPPQTPDATQNVGTPSANPKVNQQSKLSTDGLGPVMIGHSLTDAAAAAGTALTPTPGGTPSCQYYTINGGPEGVKLLSVNSVIVRVDVTSGKITTISGYGIGSSRSKIKAAFTSRIADGPGSSEIQYVPVDASDIDRRVVWELDANGIVVSLRAGRLPHINPSAACAG